MADASIVLNPGAFSTYEKPTESIDVPESLSKSGIVSAISKISSEQERFWKQLSEFLRSILSDKNNFVAKDAEKQNFYFAKKQVEDFKRILDDNPSIKIDSSSIANKVEKIVSEILSEEKTISKAELRSQTAISKAIAKAFKEICDKLRTKVKEKTAEIERKRLKDEEDMKKQVLSFMVYSYNLAFLKKTTSGLTSLGVKLASMRADVVKKFQVLRTTTLDWTKRNIYDPTKFKAWNERRLRIEKTLVDRPKQFLSKFKTDARKVIWKAVNSIKELFYVAFGLNLLMPLFKATKFALSGIVSVVKFSFSVVSGALSFAIGILRGISKLVVGVASTTANVLKKALDKIGVFSVLKITKDFLFGFFRSYLGAYILGYIVGTIYKNLEAFFGFFKNAREKIAEWVGQAKVWIDKNILGGRLRDIEDWLENLWYSAGFIMSDIYSILFAEGESVSKKIDNLVSEFALRDSKTGSKILDFSDILDVSEKFLRSLERLRYESAIRKVERAFTDVAVAIGTTIFGARIGAAVVGTALASAGMLFGGPLGAAIGGLVGNVLGSFLGAGIFNKIGRTWVNVIRRDLAFAPIESPESPFEEFMRHSGLEKSGEANIAFSEISEETDPGLYKAIQAVFSLDMNLDTATDDELVQMAKSEQFGEIPEEYRSQLSVGDPEKLRKQLQLLKILGDNLNFDNLKDEIESNQSRAEELLNANEKGYILSRDIDREDVKTNIPLLNGRNYFPMPSTTDVDKAYNPLFYKMGRATLINSYLTQLRRGHMTLEAFLDAYETLDDPFDPDALKLLEKVPIKYSGGEGTIAEVVKPAITQKADVVVLNQLQKMTLNPEVMADFSKILTTAHSNASNISETTTEIVKQSREEKARIKPSEEQLRRFVDTITSGVLFDTVVAFQRGEDVSGKMQEFFRNSEFKSYEEFEKIYLTYFIENREKDKEFANELNEIAIEIEDIIKNNQTNSQYLLILPDFSPQKNSTASNNAASIDNGLKSE